MKKKTTSLIRRKRVERVLRIRTPCDMKDIRESTRREETRRRKIQGGRRGKKKGRRARGRHKQKPKNTSDKPAQASPHRQPTLAEAGLPGLGGGDPTWLLSGHCKRRLAEGLHAGSVPRTTTLLGSFVHGAPPRCVQGNTQAVGEARAGRGRRPVPRVELRRRLSVSAKEPHHIVTRRTATGEDGGCESSKKNQDPGRRKAKTRT